MQTFWCKKLVSKMKKHCCKKYPLKFQKCLKLLEKVILNFFFKEISFEIEFCAGARLGQTCHGDSGGPLVCVIGTEPVLYGITSWGDGECTQVGVYAKVANFINWIRQTISQNL